MHSQWKEIHNQTYSKHSNTRQTSKTCIHKTLKGKEIVLAYYIKNKQNDLCNQLAYALTWRLSMNSLTHLSLANRIAPDVTPHLGLFCLLTKTSSKNGTRNKILKSILTPLKLKVDPSN